jgi:IstB-like ATP binding protein
LQLDDRIAARFGQALCRADQKGAQTFGQISTAEKLPRVFVLRRRHDLLEILEERYGRRSTIVTSQLPLDRWHEIIADPTYADVILDRLVHNAHRIELSGESMRRTRGKQNQKA